MLPPPPSSGIITRPILLIFIIGSLSAFGPLSLDMYLPAFPEMTGDLSTSASQIQLTLTACLIGLALGQAFAGPLSDVLGRRIPLVVGLLAFATLSLLCMIAPNVETLIALRFFQGMAGAAGIVLARAVVRDLYSGPALAQFFSLVLMVNGMAPILAPVIGGQLLRFTTWHGVFLVLAIFSLVLLLAVLLWLPETLPSERRQESGIAPMVGSFRVLLSDRLFIGYGLSAGMAFGAMFAYIAGSSFVIQNIYDVSPQAYSLMFGANALGIVTMAQINARLVRKAGPRRMMTIGLIGSATGGTILLAVVLLDVGLYGILVALFVVVSSIGFIAPNTAALAMANYPGSAGAASALIGLFQFGIGGLVAPLAGIAGDETAVPMGVMIACLGVGALVTSRILTRIPAGPATTSPTGS
jgi:MFS transporter, DHA1 family, multidrug resistance protein